MAEAAGATLRTLHWRPCPLCGNTDESHERYPARLDPNRLHAMSYAARKEPEYMSLRMVVCPGCDLLYAPKVPSTDFLARDVEHLQVFSPASLGAALQRAGFAQADIRPFANRYPLHYWTRLMPIPPAIKRPLHGWLRRGAGGGLGGLALRASVGNMIAWAASAQIT